MERRWTRSPAKKTPLRRRAVSSFSLNICVTLCSSSLLPCLIEPIEYRFPFLPPCSSISFVIFLLFPVTFSSLDWFVVSFDKGPGKTKTKTASFRREDRYPLWRHYGERRALYRLLDRYVARNGKSQSNTIKFICLLAIVEN